jgi:hypothetical protein
MDAGRTAIINQALLFMGQDTVLDPEGPSKNAKLCAQIYDDTLAEILSGHAWSFARVAARLQLLLETPKDARFSKSYRVPDDCARILYVGTHIEPEWMPRSAGGLTGMANTQPVAEYVVNGRNLYTNQTELQILYIRSNVQPFEMTPQFRNLFAATMANKLFVKITGSRDGARDMQHKTQMLALEARHVDSNQTDTLPVNRPNLLLAARVY